MSGFNAMVLSWLRSKRPHFGPVEVLGVEPHGTDWAGGTFEGFHQETEVSIRYKDAHGEERWAEIGGEEMASLWKHVIGAWPDE